MKLLAKDIYEAAEILESRGIDASANPDLVEALAKGHVIENIECAIRIRENGMITADEFERVIKLTIHDYLQNGNGE